jgi:hypothetical protein
VEKMKPVETVPGIGGKGINSTMIYCKNFVNATCTPSTKNKSKNV